MSKLELLRCDNLSLISSNFWKNQVNVLHFHQINTILWQGIISSIKLLVTEKSYNNIYIKCLKVQNSLLVKRKLVMQFYWNLASLKTQGLKQFNNNLKEKVILVLCEVFKSASLMYKILQNPPKCVLAKLSYSLLYSYLKFCNTYGKSYNVQQI